MTRDIALLSVVIPVYGSQSVIQDLYRQLVQSLEEGYRAFEVIFVDDNGPDKVWGEIENIVKSDGRFVGIQLMKNSGQGAATICGLHYARGDVVVTMDDDLQHPPSAIKTLTDELMDNGELDIVIGAPKEKKHSLIRRLGSSLINMMNSVFLDKNPGLRFTGFRAMRRCVAINLTQLRTPYPALGPMILQVTRRIENVPFEHQPRFLGKSNYSFSKLFKQSMSNFIGYSMLPLRLMAVFGALGIFISMSLGAYFLLRYLFVGVSTSGWTSLMLVLVSISGFMFFAFAIIGEYVLRIMQITSSNPQYSVRKVIKDVCQ